MLVQQERTSAVWRALANRQFRLLFVGALLSAMGTWMRQVTLVAWAYEETKSAALVGRITFAQLAPILVLGIPGGLLLDRYDRRKILIAVTILQLVICFGFAATVLVHPVSVPLLLALSAALGVCNALYSPGFSALLLGLVDRADMAGAVSLMSAQTNATRVIGPAVAGLAVAVIGVSKVFVVSGLSMLFVVVGLVKVTLPARAATQASGGLTRELLMGFQVAREKPVVGRALVSITIFSFVCLFFVNQMPVIAKANLGIGSTTTLYGVLYACFGAGAVLGALANGTVLGRWSDSGFISRWGMVAFAVCLTAFALARSAYSGFAFVVLVGTTYLSAVTALTSAVQSALADHERGRVSTLWSMAYAGAVGVSNLVFGPIADRVGPTPVMLLGAAVALPLAWYSGRGAAREPLLRE